MAIGINCGDSDDFDYSSGIGINRCLDYSDYDASNKEIATIKTVNKKPKITKQNSNSDKEKA